MQWNCHPETLESKNTEVSADFVGYTVKYLQDRRKCPVVYLTGTVGGLMTSLHVEVKDAKGKDLADGSFEKTERYGQLVGELGGAEHQGRQADYWRHWRSAGMVLFLPMENKLYRLGWKLNVFDRAGLRLERRPATRQRRTNPRTATTKPLCVANGGSVSNAARRPGKSQRFPAKSIPN